MIPEYIINNFNCLEEAFENNDVCIMECKDNKTGEDQYLICIHEYNPDAEAGKTESFFPFARIFKYDESDIPFDNYTPPT